jgi:hypothetical protein
LEEEISLLKEELPEGVPETGGFSSASTYKRFTKFDFATETYIFIASFLIFCWYIISL